jgi:hypothetical protein
MLFLVVGHLVEPAALLKEAVEEVVVLVHTELQQPQYLVHRQ